MPLSQEANGIVHAVEGKLQRHFGRTLQDARKEHIFRAFALTLRDHMSMQRMRTVQEQQRDRDGKDLHYLSLEFLLGRSLEKNAFNLGLIGAVKEACEALGFDANSLFETEPDAGLGNGGLGRLAACYLDSMTTLGINATGYSICYHYGIFKQKIMDGQQIELPDPWMEVGDVWLTQDMDSAHRILFGGRLIQRWHNGRMYFDLVDYTEVIAVPQDMTVVGYANGHSNTLRLWDAKSPSGFDMGLFSRGEYLKAIEQDAMAEAITKVLYPDDNHFEGKLLRLRQQYFFVSATVQDIVRKHLEKYGDLHNFHQKHVIHINDTHPALAIPELMRILIDDGGLDWDEAWDITTRSVAYTNHTILAEALETWPQNLFEMLLPRIWMILCEINDRYISTLRLRLRDEYRVSQMAVIWDGRVRMARLCAMACYAVNGVSELHSSILRERVFKDEYSLWPLKFLNVTNGVDHRRWLSQINPRLHLFIADMTGSEIYLSEPERLAELEAFASDKRALERLIEIKYANKLNFTKYLYKTQGVSLDPQSIFDVQVKRLHEYKRQLLNVLHIIYLYHRLKDDSELDIHPRTFIFGAKAAPGYYMAKRIIRLIHSVADEVNNDPVAGKKIKVVFLENFKVSLAERLMPAAEISQQISLAGMEASGTGNMKLMMNGAVTIGTMDGANVEIARLAGPDNIIIFGLLAEEVEALRKEGYNSALFSQHDPELRRVLDQISAGFSDGVRYEDIAGSLLIGDGPSDNYMLLADFRSYVNAQRKVDHIYRDKMRFARMSLLNIAASGEFAADRSVAQYAEQIWDIPLNKDKNI